MAREVLYQGLLEIPVLYQDNSKDSLGYFRISQLPNEFTAGKNLFTFKCNPVTFLDNSPLYVEVLDSAGYPIYTEVNINTENDEQYAVVSVYVDSDTAPGPATVILCGIIDRDTNGNDVNTSNGVNIRWQTPIQIYPSKRNTSDIVYSTLPSVSITSSLESYVDYFYPGNGNRFTASFHTGLNYLLYNNTAVLTTSSLSIPFRADIVSGTLYISSSDISKLVPNISTETTILSESIATIINSGSITLSNPLMIKQSNSNSFNEFRSATVNARIVYEQTPYSSSLSSKQFNLITANFSNLEPLSGTVSRVKSYYKQISVGEYILFNESDITIYESSYGYTTSSISLNLPLHDIAYTSPTDFKFEFINPDGTPSNQVVYAKNYTTYEISGSGGVSKIIAGTNVTISPVSGTGNVTINAMLSASGSGVPNGPNYSLQYNNFGNFSGSGNFTLLNNNAVYLTGSLNVSGSTTQVGNNTLLGNTLLSGSIIISGSTDVPSSPTIKIYGDLETNGVLKFTPVVKNIDTSVSASYIFVSGSTNDLYFSQNGEGYNNVTRLRWIEGSLYSGLLNGGLITTQSSTVYRVSSGSAIIVNLNASLTSNPFPTIDYINWNTLSASIAPLSASYDQSFIAINSSGSIVTQGTPYYDGDYNTKIPIGIVIHQNHSTINAVQTFPSLGYGWKQRSFDFIKAFGPLKISGYTLSPSGSSTGSLLLSGGTSWVDGRNYTVDPNNPSYIIEAVGIATSKIYRYYQSGSEWGYDTNAGIGYPVIDPSKYSNSGSLTPIASNDWSIQRVFYFPNSATKALYIYYGNTTYANKDSAIAGILTEAFNEAPNTAANAIFVGYMILRNNANFTTAASYEFRPAGLFRAIGNSGAGGGGGTTLPGGSTTQIQYNNAGTFGGVPVLTYNGTTLTATGSFTGSFTGSLFGTASWATTASYALNGGVTQLLAGSNITLSPTNGLGQVTVSSTGGGGSSFNTATGSYGSFYSTQTQTASLANTPTTMSFNTTDITNGVAISGSSNSKIKITNAGVYNLQFSAQIARSVGSGTEDVYIWLRKNGTDLSYTNTDVTFAGGTNIRQVAAWNWFINAAINDYFEIMWSTTSTNIVLQADSAPTPAVPSIILTANRIDQFLSNTGSFSGSFTGTLIGTASQAVSSSYAATASNILGGTAGYVPLWSTNTSLGSSVLFQSSSNIGIGNIPQNGFKLDVNGQSVLRGAVYTNNYLIDFGTSEWNFRNDTFSYLGRTYNVTIGATSSLSAKLGVRGTGTTSATTAFRVENANATASLVVRDDGRVGLGGITSPSQILDVSGSLNLKGSGIYINSNENYGTARIFTSYNYLAGELYIQPSASINQSFIFSPNNGMSIGGFAIGGTAGSPPAYGLAVSGSVGIGTRVPVTTLDVSGSGRFTRNLTVSGSTNITGSIVLTGSYYQSGLTQEFISVTVGGLASNASVVSKAIATATTMIFEYRALDTITGIDQRSGIITANFNSSGQTFNESVTADIGSTGMVSFNVSGPSPYQIVVNNMGMNPYEIKGILRYF